MNQSDEGVYKTAPDTPGLVVIDASYFQILEVRNPWGKVMERRGLRFENFY